MKNADGAVVLLSSPDGDLVDSVHYKAQPRWHTYGRYPDGGGSLALLDRPTIETSNHWSTSAVVDRQEVEMDVKRLVLPKGAIDCVKYYNQIGQEIAPTDGSRIVIQVIIFKNGERMVRKVVNKSGVPTN